MHETPGNEGISLRLEINTSDARHGWTSQTFSEVSRKICETNYPASLKKPVKKCKPFVDDQYYA
jgi:hypothetical protein